eukprot:scaffold123484_cov28-Tisochrysis_lutea.AAC.4
MCEIVRASSWSCVAKLTGATLRGLWVRRVLDRHPQESATAKDSTSQSGHRGAKRPGHEP